MADTFSKAKRSHIMSLIRSHGNKATELKLIEIFRVQNLKGWRRRQKVFGRPDFIFRKLHAAVFVDGCFWHACPRCAKGSKSNMAFWNEKFERNKRRDRSVTRGLRKEGWTVVRIWEHELKDQNRVAKKLEKLRNP